MITWRPGSSSPISEEIENCGSCGMMRSPFIDNRKGMKSFAQDLLFSSDFVLDRTFRNGGGPPLGVEFDQPPSDDFCVCGDDEFSSNGFIQSRDGTTVMPPTQLKKHGIGKGLMTVWRSVNLNADFPDRTATAASRPLRNCKSRRRKKQSRTNFHGRRRKTKTKVRETRNFEELMDDEELELRELEARAGPMNCCSTHLSTTGFHFCSFCKGFLPKFPPDTVELRDPFRDQDHPWNTSPHLTKKFFKVVHFIHTHTGALKIDRGSFKLRELAQGFIDKDSVLISEVHMAILRHLFHVTEMEVSQRSGISRSKQGSFLFLGFVQCVVPRTDDLDTWKKFINPMTWPEIMRQVLAVVGFGSTTVNSRRLKKKADDSVPSLQTGTLKRRLFEILSTVGNVGMDVSEIAVRIRSDSPGDLISSALASDVTLFERISPTAYRLRGGGSGETAAVEIDERRCHTGEAWLAGLEEGEYSDLTVDAKLDALIAMIGLLPVGDDESSRGAALLGSDRRFNRYWLFGGDRRVVYFESSEDGQWSVIDGARCLDSLVCSLDGRGRRESQLIASLARMPARRTDDDSTSSDVVDDFGVWVWRSGMLTARRGDDPLTRCEDCHDLYWIDHEKHCPRCHSTFELDFDVEAKYEVHRSTCRGVWTALPCRIQFLKAAVYALESSIAVWTRVTRPRRNLWVKRLRRSSTLDQLGQTITDLIRGISMTQPVPPLVRELVTVFPMVPRTTSAIALWLVRLDAVVGLGQVVI